MDQYDHAFYCKIFLNTPLKIDEIRLLVADAIGGRSNRRRVESGDVIIDVNANDDYDPSTPALETSWPYYLDTNMSTAGTPPTYKLGGANMLRFLRDRGIAAIPACDFEDELI